MPFSNFWLTIKTKLRLPAGMTALIIVLYLASLLIFGSPVGFPNHKVISISDGATTAAVAEILSEEKLIKSRLVFLAWSRLVGKEDNVRSGEYLFERPLSVFMLSQRLFNGVYGVGYVRVTILEGLSSKEMAKVLAGKFPAVNQERFVNLASKDEGFLFPDTYFFSPFIREEAIIARLKQNFREKIKPLEEEITLSERSLKEIITMASLLEKESHRRADKEIIAGVLWKRLAIGMPLQVDAVFPYIIGKNTFELSLNDLATDSPYNTYRYPGLPPGPITNPGLESIEAALRPVETPNLYYLADETGRTHFAATFEDHKRNKSIYLR